jgi:hypothetical protein
VTQLNLVESAVAGLTEAQLAEIRAGEKLGKSKEDIAKQLKLSESVIDAASEKLKTREKEAEARQKAVKKAQDETRESAEKLAAQYEDLMSWVRSLNSEYRNNIGLMRMQEDLMAAGILHGGAVPGVPGTSLELFGRNGGQQLGMQGLARPNASGGQFSSGGGMNFFQQGLSDIFGGATSVGQGARNTLRGIGKGMFNEIGTLMTGGISSLLNMGIGALGKGLGKLFGRDEESRQVNPMRDQFIEAAGGLGVLNERAHDAGVTLDELFRADTVEEFQSAVESLTGAMDFQGEAMESVREAMDRWGLSVADMGQAFSQQELNTQATALIEDFRVLEAAGADVATISEHMTAGINEYVRNALAAGATVPAAMHDIIQQMVTQGLLLDENGEAFESLEETGITFAETLDSQFKSLMDRIGDLVDAITRGLGGAINNLPDLNIQGNVHWNIPDPYLATDGSFGIQPLPMEAGSASRVTRTTLKAGGARPVQFAFA